MMAPNALIYLLCAIFFLDCVLSLEFRPNCGYPGKPYGAKISPEEKLIYADGDTVSYHCADYWAPPQERKCVNGAWTGPQARCGRTIPSLIAMRDARTVDLTTSQEMWHHTNMTLIKRPWKYPNVFTSNRFPKARMRITDDHEYQWSFNFSQAIPKLFVKINFNFLNFTDLPEETQTAHVFEIAIEVSPFRRCTLQYQNSNPWVNSGNRVDSYFACDSLSPEALLEEASNPPNYLLMRTKSSHSITHELIALMFGQAYGTPEKALCGEPEVNYGQSFRANEKYTDYQIDCADKDNWITLGIADRMKADLLGYSLKCSGDMRWKGDMPDCVPKKFCTLGELFNQMDVHRKDSDPGDANSRLIIESISGYYHYSNDTIYATVGTQLTYNCLEPERFLLLGKDTRKCTEYGTWSGAEPTCRVLQLSEKQIESFSSMLVTIIVVAVVIIAILLLITTTVSCLLCALFRQQNKGEPVFVGSATWPKEKSQLTNIGWAG